MSAPDELERWAHAQGSQAIPEGFSDRVMGALPAREGRLGGVAEATLWIAAVLVLAIRVSGTLAVLWTG